LVDGDESLGGVKEVEVEREAHAEGVDAGAARNEETAARFRAIEMGKAEQAGAKPRGLANLPPEDGGQGQPSQLRGDAFSHATPSPEQPTFSPKPRLTSLYVAHRRD
jgi:hypothetical protein